MKTVSGIVKFLLLVIIVGLSYMLVESIMNPIRFNREKDKRYEKTIQRLKDIRTAQLAYRSEHHKFTGSFDTLIDFVRNGSFTVIKQVGSMDDSVALARGLVYREEISIAVLDSIFPENYPLDSLRVIPFTKGIEFEMGAGQIVTGSGLSVEVFEAKAHNDIVLNGLNRQEIINLNDLRKKLERYPGLQVGSLTEATNNAGNWE